jgi:hypothetical protein
MAVMNLHKARGTGHVGACDRQRREELASGVARQDC